MTAFVDLIPQVLSDVPQADEISIERSIVRAVRKFCEKTALLKVTTSPALNVVANQAEYTLPAVTNRDIVRIARQGVRWGNDVWPDHKTEDELDLEEPGKLRFFLPEDASEASVIGSLGRPWRTEVGVPPIYYFQSLPDTLRLVPIPNVSLSAQLTVTYILKPSMTATEVDTFLISQWYEKILPGILAELLKIRQKPWTDLNLAGGYLKQFDQDIAEVLGDRVAGYGHNDYEVGRVRAYS